MAGASPLAERRRSLSRPRLVWLFFSSNGFEEMTWKSALRSASLARKRQTPEIRHLFHVAEPGEGPRAGGLT